MKRKGKVARGQAGQQFFHRAAVQPDAQVNQVPAFADAKVKPGIPFGIDFKRGRLFIPDRRKIPMIGPFNILRLKAALC